MKTEPTTTIQPWMAAGEAWSHAATDWAYRFEPYARDAIEDVFSALGIAPGTRLLDVACGAGLAMGRARRLGAVVSGIDAAAGLLDIAARRVRDAELVHGDMFVLPWGDARFDAVVAFNGIWGGCDRAVAEMARVCRPGGHVAVTFWGDANRLDLLPYFMTLGAAGPGVTEEIVELAAINQPGRAEQLFCDAGLEVLERGTSSAILEFADDVDAWRALRSPGLAVPSLEHTGEVELGRQVLDAISSLRADDGSYRLENELVYVIARKPTVGGCT